MKRSEFFAIPDDLRSTSQEEQISAGKINEQETRLRVEPNVTERIEVVVAREIRKGERYVIVNSHEPGLTAAVRHIRTLRRIIFGVFAGDHVVCRNKEVIGRIDDRPRSLIKLLEFMYGVYFIIVAEGTAGHHFSRLNVFGAVAEGLAHPDLHALIVMPDQTACEAIAAPRRIVQSEESELNTCYQVVAQWVAVNRLSGNAQSSRIR